MWENWPKGVYWRCNALHFAGLYLCLIILGWLEACSKRTRWIVKTVTPYPVNGQ